MKMRDDYCPKELSTIHLNLPSLKIGKELLKRLEDRILCLRTEESLVEYHVEIVHGNCNDRYDSIDEFDSRLLPDSTRKIEILAILKGDIAGAVMVELDADMGLPIMIVGAHNFSGPSKPAVAALANDLHNVFLDFKTPYSFIYPFPKIVYFFSPYATLSALLIAIVINASRPDHLWSILVWIAIFLMAVGLRNFWPYMYFETHRQSIKTSIGHALLALVLAVILVPFFKSLWTEMN